MGKQYPSEITREQFEKIRPILESARKTTKLHVVELYGIFCAMLYLVKNGCQWKMLPSDFPKWNVIYFYFQIWSKKEENEGSILGKVLKDLVVELRTKEESKEKTRMLILDTQTYIEHKWFKITDYQTFRILNA